MKDKNNQSRRFGFVEIHASNATHSRYEQHDVLGERNAHIIDGKEVDCKMAVPRDPKEEKRKVEAKRRKRREKRERRQAGASPSIEDETLEPSMPTGLGQEGPRVIL